LKTALAVAGMVAALALLATVLYAVAITLPSASVPEIGGTGQVDVECPVSGCQIARVDWLRDSSAPYYVTGVAVTWTPATGGGVYYVVHAIIRDNDGNILASGGATVTVSGSPSEITTNVNVDSVVNPKDIYKVEILIMEII